MDAEALDEAGEQAFNKALISDNHTRLTAEIVDANRDVKHVIEYQPEDGLSGQIDLDCTSQIANGGQSSGSIWSVAFTAFGPRSQLGLAGSLFVNRWLQIIWGIWVPELDDYVDTILSCGPCSAPVVQGPLISIQAQGPEVWWRRGVRRARTWKAGGKTTDAIRAILHEECGIPLAWIDVPNLPDELEDDYQAKFDIDWYDAAQYLAESINCDLFPARDGTATLRQRPTQTRYVIPTAALTTIPQKSIQVGGPGQQGNDLSYLYTLWLVYGKRKPQKPRSDGKIAKPAPLIGKWATPAWHKFSAKKLGEPGPPWVNPNRYTNEHLHTQAAVDQSAENRGRRGLQMAEVDNISTCMIPHIQPYQTFTRGDDSRKGTWEYLRGTTPLQPSQDTPQTWNFRSRASTQPRRPRG